MPFRADPQTRRHHDRLRQSLAADTEQIKAVRETRLIAVAAVGEAKRMASLSSVADRIKAKKQLYAEKAESWGARLDALDKREPDAFAATEAAIVSHETDLSDMEADMRALSNGGPPTSSQQSPEGSHG